jgi:hypothetical protein
MPRLRISSTLGGTDRRSIGRSNEVACLVLKNPRRFPELIACLWHENPVIRLRAADAAEKVSVKQPGLVQRHKAELLGLLAETTQIELRWHLAAIIPRLNLSSNERRRAIADLHRYLDDRSSLVKTFALQALFDLSQNDTALRENAKRLLEQALHSGTPAMKARARNILRKLAS